LADDNSTQILTNLIDIAIGESFGFQYGASEVLWQQEIDPARIIAYFASRTKCASVLAALSRVKY
jgi:hypothetical protein